MSAAPLAAPRPPVRARALLAVLAFVLGLGTIPHRVCERDAEGYFQGDPRVVAPLAASVTAWTESELSPNAFATGSPRFDGEWLFGTYMMAAMGFGQVALTETDPKARAEDIRRMEHCLDEVLSPAARTFDRESWTLDPFDSMEAWPGSAQDRGHAAYLGYAGLALGLHRLVVPTSRFDTRHDQIALALERRFVASTTGLLETYPGEVYPVDNASALATLALHARATNTPLGPGGRRGLEAMRTLGVQPKTGLLTQSVSPVDGSPRDPGRGSGTALAAYFLSYADPALSSALYYALKRELYRTVIGFGVVLEHPATCVDCTGRVDIDSGPTVAGFGVSATGFAIGAARANDDRETFASLYATAHLFGAPSDGPANRTFATGGPLGDAILFAMLTAKRPS